MQKVRSPLKQALSNLLQLTDRPAKVNPHKEKPFPSILNKTHDQQHRRNTNSIKKVLKELQDLKKDLNQLKKTKQIQATPQQLDNSKCRRLKAETRKSSPSQDPRSHSSSRNKTLSHHKETSTQTKPFNKQSKDFSFTAQQHPLTQSPKQFHQEEQDSNEYNPFTIRTQKSPSDERKKKSIDRREEDTLILGKKIKKDKTIEQIQSIQSAQVYQRYLNSLKNSFSILQVSSAAFSGEERLKINIELERLSTQIRRIPMHIKDTIQYYQNVTVYARNLNNQLNNFAILLNRCDNRSRERVNNAPKQSSSCKNCEQNQKRDWQRYHKRELKRVQKEVNKLQEELEQAKLQINTLSTHNLILMKEKQDLTSKHSLCEKKASQQERKIRMLIDQKEQLERQLKEAEGKRAKQHQKNILLEEDLSYYKSEIERFKKNAHFWKDGGQKREQQSQIVNELKDKEILYQTIIKDKEAQIVDLKKKITDLFEQLNQELNHDQYKRRPQEKGQSSSQPSQLIQLKREGQEKNRLIANNYREIEVWKLRSQKLETRNKELQFILEQCTQQISKLHAQINALEESSDMYREKYLKTRPKNENKPRRQLEGKNRKQSAFNQLNELIRNHRSNIQNDQK